MQALSLCFRGSFREIRENAIWFIEMNENARKIPSNFFVEILLDFKIAFAIILLEFADFG